MQFYRKLNIKNKLLMMFLLQMLLPIFVLGFFMLRNVENNMKSQAITLSQDMLKVLEFRIEDFAEDIKSVSQDLLYDLEIYAVLNDDQEDKFTYYHNVNNLKNVLRTITLSDESIQAISIIDQSNNNYTYDITSGRLNTINHLPYDVLLEIAREAEGRPVWYVDQIKDKGNIYLTRIINDIDTFNEVGLLVIQVNMEPMKKDYANLSSDIFEEVYLVEDDGNIVFASADSELDTSTLREKAPTGVFYEDDKKERMISFRKIENPNWTVVTAISKDALLEDVNKFTIYSFIIFLPLALLLSLFTIYEGMHMVEALNRIVHGMEDVSKGMKHVNIEVDRQDEIGFLAHSFNDMTTEIENLVDNIYNEQITRKEVEIKALQAQINPHFLYNTLETINWHAQLKGAPEISHMVTALSSIMEASIGRDNKLITFRDEMKYIENYISIMKYRYEGRLEFDRRVDPSILGIKIPRLILQPIIENSINHGIGQSSTIGKIDIVAEKKNNHIVIEVCDNGKGMRPDELETLLEKINSNDGNKSIGLENVNKRLKLFYGEEYGIRIMSELDAFTKVIIIIPEKKLNEGDIYYV